MANPHEAPANEKDTNAVIFRELGETFDSVEEVRSIGAVADLTAKEWHLDSEIDVAKPWTALDARDRQVAAEDIYRVLDVADWLRGVDDSCRRLLSVPALRALDDAHRAFLDALPFSDAERRWLVARANEADDRYRDFGSSTEIKSTEDPLDYIAGCQDTIVTLGRHQAVSGRELLDRWWDWRRDTGAFQEHGSQVAVLAALGGIALLVNTPVGHVFPPHEALRRYHAWQEVANADETRP
jgi:hypothetical protein